MRAAVLFSGIGGWEIAAELNGIETAWAAEWDDWKRARYAERWPDTPLYGDVGGLDGRQLVDAHGPIDLLLGSPPCTDISAANVNGCGIDGDESRYYLEAIRLAREIGPRWLCLENSPRLRTRGADRVLAELEAGGYACWANVVEAEDAGAPHERGRSFVVGCRRDAIEGADALGGGLRIKQGWRGGADRTGAAEPQAHADADTSGQPDGAVNAEMGRRARADGAAGQCGGEAADVSGIGCGAGRSRRLDPGHPRQQDELGSRPTPCHSASRARSEWQGVGSDPFEKLTPAQRAALSPWDQRGDGLAGYLSMAHGLADRLRGHGLSERAVKAELARWRSALGDALVIPVVWAVLRAIVRTDQQIKQSMETAA